MRVVVALGDNALLERTERPDADIQERHVLRVEDPLTVTGGLAAIGRLTDAPLLLAGNAGTVIEPLGDAESG